MKLYNKSNSYSSYKNNYSRFDKDSAVFSFFSGLDDVTSLGRVRRYQNFQSLVYNLRYAIAIFVIGIAIFFTTLPFTRQAYIERKFDQVLYKEMTTSLFDSSDIWKVESVNYNHSSVDGLSSESSLDLFYTY